MRWGARGVVQFDQHLTGTVLRTDWQGQGRMIRGHIRAPCSNSGKR